MLEGSTLIVSCGILYLEELICRREIGNAEDRYAVGMYITEENALVGHLPRWISLLCSIFLRGGGNISCKVSGTRR